MVKNVRSKKGFRSLSVLLSVLLIVASFSVGSVAAAGEEAQNHWAKRELNDFSGKGFLKGDEGGWRPNDDITRGEFVALVNRVEGYSEMSSEIDKYTDVSKTDWYYNDFAIALKKGYIKGVGNNKLDPKGIITRQQAMVIISRIYDLKVKDKYYKLAEDGEDVADWAVEGVSAAVGKGYFTGWENKLFPTKNLTRAQAIVVLYRDINLVRVFSFPGKYDLEDEKINNLIIKGGNLRISHVIVEKDVVYDPQEGADQGDIVLEDSTVKGDVINDSKKGVFHTPKTKVLGEKKSSDGRTTADSFDTEDDANVGKTDTNIEDPDVPEGGGSAGGFIPDDGSTTPSTPSAQSIINDMFADAISDENNISMALFGRAENGDGSRVEERVVKADVADANNSTYTEYASYDVTTKADLLGKLREIGNVTITRYNVFTKADGTPYLNEARFTQLDNINNVASITPIKGLINFDGSQRPVDIKAANSANIATIDAFVASTKNLLANFDAFRANLKNELDSDRPHFNGKMVQMEVVVDGTDTYKTTTNDIGPLADGMKKVVEQLDKPVKEYLTKEHVWYVKVTADGQQLSKTTYRISALTQKTLKRNKVQSIAQKLIDCKVVDSTSFVGGSHVNLAALSSAVKNNKLNAAEVKLVKDNLE